MDLVERVRAGDRRAIARLISMVEDGAPGVEEMLARLHTASARGYVVGVTGPPGSGKSTLVGRLARRYRRMERTVGIIAVDPTSPFTGGAILGDRVRMTEAMGDPGIFIRSMATRGHLGGLARATADAVKVLEAAGRDVVIVETVGAGQAEVDIARTAHSTVVVEVPGLGDDVQAIKAGLMEIADVFAVNKSDLDHADRVVVALEAALRLGPAGPWKPPVVKVVAATGQGIDDLVEALEGHRRFLREDDRWQRREEERVRFQLLEMVEQRLTQRFVAGLAPGELDRLVGEIVARRADPYSAVESLINRTARKGSH